MYVHCSHYAEGLHFSAFINPRRACAARVTVVGSVCVSVKSHLTYGASVRPENAVTYSAGNEGQTICGVFSETAPLQRSSTPSVVRPCVQSAIFPCVFLVYAHAYFSCIYAHDTPPRVQHFSAFHWVCLSVCLSVKSHLTYGASVRPENAVTYSAGTEGLNICGVFSETAPLQRSSTPSVVRLMRSRPFLSLRKMRMRMSSPSISGALAHVYTLQPLRRGFAL